MALIFSRRFPLRCLHSLAQFTTGVNPDDHFRTKESNPAKHTISDVGRFYTLPNDLALNQLFKFGGWPKPYYKQCETFSESCVMVRKPGLEIIHYLENADYSQPINKYLLFGKNGTGKTLTVSYILHYAHVNDWLIVHLPSLVNCLTYPKEVTNSSTRIGFVDLNFRATEWLVHFKTQNQKLLAEKKLPIHKDYQWNIRESSSSGDSLLSVVDYGISRGSTSSEVVCVILEEIKQLSKDGLVKTIVLIDEYNAMFHSFSNICNPEKITFPAEKVSFLAAFKDLTLSDWHNGAAVLVCDPIAVPEHNESHLPLYQLTLKGFEFIFPFIPVEVPLFSESEFNNVLKYYKDRLWLRTDEGDEELKFLSGCNGMELMRICAPL